MGAVVKRWKRGEENQSMEYYSLQGGKSDWLLDSKLATILCPQDAKVIAEHWSKKDKKHTYKDEVVVEAS